ncbi:hypothetical protein MKW92_030551 [Papaver armeniacum]|nr:hypothetical protein MKW92_030551 [Papaver armeniacum]
MNENQVIMAAKQEERFKLPDQMELQEFPDKYLIRSVDNSSQQQQTFSIDRSDGIIQPVPLSENACSWLFRDTCDANPTKVSTIYGVVGTIRLLAGTYLLVITSRKEVGTYLGFTIFRVMSMKFMACNGSLSYSSYQEKKDEAYFMSLLRTVESTPGLYYSYETDLTLNLQRTYKLAEERIRKPLWKQADPRFVWNRSLLEDLIECKLDTFVIPLVQGSFQTSQFTLKDSPVRITLISRRCTRRLGTRMWRRGANFEGDTANFIETEQILEFGGFTSSILQVRGSIPLLWEQIVDLSYKPRIKIISHEETPKAVERHFNDLKQRYGDVVVLDLTDKRGDEGQLSAAFANEMQKLPQFRYVSFDFHHHCGNSNLDNIELLYDQISEDIEKQGYFLVDSEGQIIAEQTGVARANCIDCLDRTNVTQSFLARKSLNSQLHRMGALSSSECISTFDEIYEMFKILWVEQGDEISLEYCGTNALKRDLVRFGKQTLDAMDLISGRYTVYLPVASALLIGGITVTSLTFNHVGRNVQHCVTTIIWAGLAAGATAVVKANGRQFCSRPRLCGLL